MKLADDIGSGEFSLRARVGLARVKVSVKETDTLWALTERIRADARESRTIIIDREGQFLQGEFYRLTGSGDAALENFQAVLAYAQDQNLFELSIKCAVRIRELAESGSPAIVSFLEELAQRYDRDNGPGSWTALLDSPYFSFFRNVLASSQHVRNSW